MRSLLGTIRSFATALAVGSAVIACQGQADPSASSAEPALRGIASPPAIVLDEASGLVPGAARAGLVDVARLRGSPLVTALRDAKVPEVDEGLAGFEKKCGFALLDAASQVAFSQLETGETLLAVRAAVPVDRIMRCLGALGFEEKRIDHRVARVRNRTIAVAQDGIVLLGEDDEIRRALSGTRDLATAQRLALGDGEVARVTAAVTQKLERIDARLTSTAARFGLALTLTFPSHELAERGRALAQTIWTQSAEATKPTRPVEAPTLVQDGRIVQAEMGVVGGADAQLDYLRALVEVGVYAYRSYTGEVPPPSASTAAAASASVAAPPTPALRRIPVSAPLDAPR
jgi:hypothetical protein